MKKLLILLFLTLALALSSAAAARAEVTLNRYAEAEAAMAAAQFTEEKVDVSKCNSVTCPPAICNDANKITTAPIAISSSGKNQIVALSGTTLIYICGYDILADGDVDLQFVYGTGSSCGTGETNISGLYPLGATNGRGFVRTNAGHVQIKVPSGQAFCIELSGAIAVGGYLTFVQQNAP